MLSAKRSRLRGFHAIRSLRHNRETMLFADDARRVVQDLPIRLPKRLSMRLSQSAGEDKLLGRQTTTWLHDVHGDPITGRAKKEVRAELFKEEEDADAEAEASAGMSSMPMMEAGKIDIDKMRVHIVIEDPVSRAMPRTYLDGLSEVEFSVTSQTARHCLVTLRWEIHGAHTGPLLGYPGTQRNLTVTGITMVRFDKTPLPDGTPGFTAKEELTYWDLPSLLDQLGGLQ
jgi:hypothetical protein